MRLGFGAALLATALAEQTFDFPRYAENSDKPANTDWPPITTPLTFVQTAGQENFNVMFDQTHGDPDPPELGKSDVFTVTGLATHPLEIAELEF